MTEAIGLLYRKRVRAIRKSESLAAKEMEKLLAARRLVREELEISINNYNHITDSALMDFYIYKIRSQEALEGYLIREIRKLEKEIS